MQRRASLTLKCNAGILEVLIAFEFGTENCHFRYWILKFVGRKQSDVCVGWWGYQTNKDRNREGGEGRIALVIMQTISQSSWRKTYRASTKSAMQINILFALSRFSIRCFRRSSKHVRRSVTASFCRRRKRFRATRAPRWGSSSRSRTSVDHVSWTLLSEVKCQ